MKNTLRYFFRSIAFLSFLIPFFAEAGNPLIKSQSVLNTPDWSFRENKGQLMDENRSPLKDIPFYGMQGGVKIYCKRGAISFVFSKTENDEKVSEATGQPEFNPMGKFGKNKPKSSKIIVERAELQFLNSNRNAEIVATDQQEYFENYYTTGDANHGIENVHTYKTIRYKNIYPEIDMVLEAKENGMEYSFIVNPGGDVADIQMRWNGMENIKQLVNGGIAYGFPKLTAESTVPAFTESSPYSYQQSTTNDQQLKINSKFIIHNSTLSFQVSHYDKTKTLVIDPSYYWGTYYGGSYDEYCFGICTDANNNVYITGVTSSSDSIASSGAYQTSYANGTSDAFLAKFNSSGSLAWATYFGGSSVEYGNAVVTDHNNNVYITGYSASSGLATSGAYQTSNNGNEDAFVAKFTSSGSLKWATYYGGTQLDEAYGICADANNNIYITGYTGSNSDIATSGAYQTSFGGYEDAFVAKFTSSGSLAWGTYYGGKDVDFGNAMCVDANNNILLTGYTYSTNGIATKGTYKTSGGGTYWDAFVAKFTQAGALTWGTYYGGSDNDQGFSISSDADSNIYITGQTSSTSGIATSGAYLTSGSGYIGSAFIAKFTYSGGLSWATYYGGSGGDWSAGVIADPYKNIYVYGSTGSSSGIATSGAYQTSLAGSHDAFLVKFTSSGSLKWGTYYGGSATDIGYGIARDVNNNFYISGYTYSTSGIATSGTYQTSGGGTYFDGFVAKFNFNIKNNSRVASFSLPASNSCTGSQPVQVMLKNFGNNTLTSDSIYWEINGVAQTAIKWTGSLQTDSSDTVTLGTYTFSAGANTLKAWATKPNGVIDSLVGNDTVNATILAFSPLTGVNPGTNQTICLGDSASIGAAAIAGSSYAWTSIPSGFTSSLPNPTVKPAKTTTFYVTATNPCGSKTDSVVITVNPLPSANAGNNTAICYGANARIGATAVSGNAYSWTSKPAGFTSTSSNPSVSPTTTTTYYLNDTITATGCHKSNSVVVTVNPVPTANAGSASTICPGAKTSIGSPVVSGNTYSWTSRPAGFTTTVSKTSVSPSATTTYYLIVTITASGCSSTDSVVVTVNLAPSANTGGNASICSGASTTIGATAVSGDTYSWTSKPSGFTSTSANPSVSPISNSVYYLTETITATGCSKSDSAVISINPLPAVNAGSNSVICSGKSSSVGATAISGYSYSWTSNPVGFTSTSSNSSVSPLSTTTYFLTETITATGCSNSDSVVITVNALPDASFIQSVTGTSVKFVPTDSTLTSYRWSYGDGGTGTSVKPTHIYSAYGTYTVHLSVQNSNGCTLADSTVITIKSVSAILNVNDTNCANTAVSFSDSSVSNSCGAINTWLWTFGDGVTSSSQNPSHTYTSAGSYAVKLIVSSSGGCSDSITKNIFVDSTCVWPGDANDNKLVEITDVLNIGIAYSNTGAKRGMPNNFWKGQYCDNWGKKFLTGTDYKHADCNGDGVVDSSDLMAISINSGDSHKKTGPSSSGSSNDPPLYLAFSKTSYNPGDTAKAEIMLGSTASSLANMYGMASSFNFDLSYVDTNTLKIEFKKSWFGTPGKDMLSFTLPEFASGSILFAITRIDHNNISGNGSIGTLSFVIPQKAKANNSIHFTPGSTKLIAFNETVLPIYTPVDTFAVQTPTGIPSADNLSLGLKVSPNPFTSIFSVSYTIPQYQNVLLILTDVTGKQIANLTNESQNPGQHDFTFDAEKYTMPAGVYFLRMVTGGQTMEEKIIRIK